MSNSSSSTKSNRASVAGFSPDIYERIKALEKYHTKEIDSLLQYED